jgi:hypothetical protein
MALITCALLTSATFASQDHYVPFSKLHWESEIDRVTVDAAQSRDGLTALRIGAFGRVYELSQKDLERFRDFIANDVALMGGPMQEKWGGGHLTLEFSLRNYGEKPFERRLVMVLKDGRYYIGKDIEELLDQLAAR